MNLGENIYKFRSANSMSQGDLADALAVSRQSVSKWENNNAVPELDKLIKMAELFGISLDELVGQQSSASHIRPHTPAVNNAKSNTNFRKIIGIILVCTGAIFLLMALSATHASVFVSQLLFGVFFMICGAVYLNAKSHPGLYCLFVLYLFLWPPMGILSPNHIHITFARLIQLIHMGLGGSILLYSWKTAQIVPLWKRKGFTIAFYSILCATIMISLLVLLFPGLLPTPGLQSF